MTEITVVARAQAALGYVEAKLKLSELASMSKPLVAITNKDDYEAVHKARMVLKNTRVEIARLGKAGRDEALAYQKAVIATENELICLIEPEEKRLQALQDAHDAEIKRQKDEAAAREKARLAAIQGRLNALRDAPLAVIGGSVDQIKAALDSLRAADADAFEGADLETARSNKRQALAQLEAMLVSAQQAEEAKAALEVQRAELAKLEAAAAERREQQRIEDEAARKKQAEADEARSAELAAERAEVERQRREVEIAKAAQLREAEEREIREASLGEAITGALEELRVAGRETSLAYRKLQAVWAGMNNKTT